MPAGFYSFGFVVLLATALVELLVHIMATGLYIHVQSLDQTSVPSRFDSWQFRKSAMRPMFIWEIVWYAKARRLHRLFRRWWLWHEPLDPYNSGALTLYKGRVVLYWAYVVLVPVVAVLLFLLLPRG